VVAEAKGQVLPHIRPAGFEAIRTFEHRRVAIGAADHALHGLTGRDLGTADAHRRRCVPGERLDRRVVAQRFLHHVLDRGREGCSSCVPGVERGSLEARLTPQVWRPHRGPRLARMKWRPVFAGVLQLFGLDSLADRLSKGPPSPEYERLDRLIRERLGEVWHNARALERGPRAACASASIFDELTPLGMASIAWTTLPYEGDLDGIPLLLVAPGDMQDLEQVAEMIDDEAPTPGQLDAARLQRFYQRSRERYLNLSDLSERVTAPPGTAHNFPYEAPDFVIEVVRQTLHRLAAGPPWKAQP